MPDDSARSNPGGPAAIYWVVLGACLLGFTVAAELTRIHYRVHTDPTFRSVCAVDKEVNCETVAQSPYAVFAWLPVSVWGGLAYLVLAALTLWGLTKGRSRRNFPIGILTALSSGSLLVSALLAAISLLRINSICLFCTALYGINTLLFIFIVAHLIRHRLNPLAALAADLKALVRHPLISPCLLGIPTALAALLVWFVPPYWHHPAWHDLPELPSGTDETGKHWIGATDPQLTITEFSDYQCTHCRRAHKETRLLIGKYPQRVRLVHEHVPLDPACNPTVEEAVHSRACELAEAAECAGAQGAFWKMNDALFSIQESVSSSDVNPELLAVQLGLDRAAFVECLATHATLGRIRTGIEAGRKLRIIGTPTYFIGKQPYPGGIPPGVVLKLLDR